MIPLELVEEEAEAWECRELPAMASRATSGDITDEEDTGRLGSVILPGEFDDYNWRYVIKGWT